MTTDPETLVLRLSGTYNMDRSRELDRELRDLIENPDRDVVVDCGETDYLNSHAMSVLLHLCKALIQREHSMHLSGASEDILRLFDVVGLTPLVRVHPSIRAALDESRKEDE